MVVAPLRRRPPAPRPLARPEGMEQLLRELDAPEAPQVDTGWSLGYADLLLLLLTLFAVLLGMSLLGEGAPEPSSLVADLQLNVLPPARTALDPKVLLAVLNTRPVPPAPRVSRPRAVSVPQAKAAPPVLRVGSPSVVERQPLVSPPVRSKGPLDRVADLLAGQGGDRLELFLEGTEIRMEVGSGILFPSGNADLTEEGRRLLDDLAPTLLAEDLEISVEGHTDDRPIHSRRFRSNWELSSLRATEVVRYLLAKGVPAARLHAAGFADTRPRVANDSPAHRALNRRVSILLHLPVGEGEVPASGRRL